MGFGRRKDTAISQAREKGNSENRDYKVHEFCLRVVTETNKFTRTNGIFRPSQLVANLKTATVAVSENRNRMLEPHAAETQGRLVWCSGKRKDMN
jgi:hypothetical protein